MQRGASEWDEFECRGKDSGIVCFTYEMLETLKQVVEDEEKPRAFPN
jgi:hypothetical protein